MGATGVTSVVAAYTASTATLLLSVLFGALSIAMYALPEDAYTEPEPAFERTHIRSDGMTPQEIDDRLRIIMERNKFKQEKQEREAEKARRDAKRRQNARTRFG